MTDLIPFAFIALSRPPATTSLSTALTAEVTPPATPFDTAAAGDILTVREV